MSPVLVERPWGGRRLERFGKELPVGPMIGESWEVADLPGHVAPTVEDPRSRVAEGPYAGAVLSELIERFADDLLGPVPPTADGRFPLLIKLLDARENLSVQVHPDAGYVADHPGTHLKTESWYVVDADPGAELMLDVIDGVDADDVARAAGTPEVVGMLGRVGADVGSFHHVPAGLIHAIGAGVMVAEVQTPSDTTFRLYDWAVEYRRPPRQLHLTESLRSLRLHPPDAFSLPPASSTRTLIRNPHFWIREHHDPRPRLSADPGPRVLMAISGTTRVAGVDYPAGSTLLIPAAGLGVSVEADGVVLEIGL